MELNFNESTFMHQVKITKQNKNIVNLQVVQKISYVKVSMVCPWPTFHDFMFPASHKVDVASSRNGIFALSL